MKLAVLQHRIQESIIAGGTDAAALLKQPAEGSRESRLSVYQSAFALRHAEFLRNDLPVLCAYMGEDRFSAMARLYAKSKPSSQANARWFSANVPAYLRITLPYSRKPELSEIASLETALNDAFDAEDRRHLSFEDLAQAEPAAFAAMSLTISPSAQLLSFKTNATSIWCSLKADERPPSPMSLDAPQDVLVWRQNLTSRFRLLGAEETMALVSAREGVPFGVMCEMIAHRDDPDTAGQRAASYLRSWVESELVVALRLADAASVK
jgi:hypothetical protein